MKHDDYNTQLNTKPRILDNKEWVLPYSCKFKVLKINNFNAFQCSINVCMMVHILIKFTGMPNQLDVMNHVKRSCDRRKKCGGCSFMCLINQEENPLCNGKLRFARLYLEHSRDAKFYQPGESGSERCLQNKCFMG
jgi:hypothetical protein